MMIVEREEVDGVTWYTMVYACRRSGKSHTHHIVRGTDRAELERETRRRCGWHRVHTPPFKRISVTDGQLQTDLGGTYCTENEGWWDRFLYWLVSGRPFFLDMLDALSGRVNVPYTAPHYGVLHVPKQR